MDSDQLDQKVKEINGQGENGESKPNKEVRGVMAMAFGSKGETNGEEGEFEGMNLKGIGTK